MPRCMLREVRTLLSLRQLQAFVPQARTADAVMLMRHAVLDWLIIGACWAVMSQLAHPLTYVLGVLVIAGRMHALGVVLHDACHRPSRRKTPMMRAVEALAGWPIGSTIDAMRYHHLRHHRALCSRDDPYLHAFALRGPWAAALTASRGALLPFWWSLRAFSAPLALVWPSFRVLYARGFLQDRSGNDLRNHPEVLACAWADLPQAAMHSAAAAVILALDLPFVSHYLVPWIIGGIFNARRVIVEHDLREIEDASRETIWRATRTHNGSWLSRLLLYPHNIGFHQAHHLYPTIAFTALPIVHAALSSDLEARLARS